MDKIVIIVDQIITTVTINKEIGLKKVYSKNLKYIYCNTNGFRAIVVTVHIVYRYAIRIIIITRTFLTYTI